MSEFFYNGLWRMDWGLGNPNKTAALIAVLMVAVWGFAYWKRWGFWLSLVLFTVLGGCLIHTVSRGGVIAVFAGLAPVVWKAPRPWPKRRILAGVVAVWVMIGFSVYLNAFSRYGQGIVQEDRSITNRLEIWKAAPAMMTDAPGGWGLGRSGKAYVQWYQPLDDQESYRTLVNSHLTWLVEFGWLGRFAYLFGWAAVMMLCWPAAGRSWMVIPFGIWTAFGVASVFSSVAESPWLWIVPGLALTAILGCRLACRLWPRLQAWGMPATAALVICLGFALAGLNHAKVHFSEDRVVIGEGAPGLWIVPDEKILGRHYGKTLRRYLNENPSGRAIGIASSPDHLPSNIGSAALVVAGTIGEAQRNRLAALSSQAAHLILLTPEFYPQELNLPKADRTAIQAVFGEFSPSFHASAWESAGLVKRIPGAGDFLPSWPEIMMEEL